MSVGSICQREVDVAYPHETVQAVARRMHQRKVGSLVVVDGASRPVGIITDRDLALRVVGEGRDTGVTLVSEVMSTHLATADEKTTLEYALSTMRSIGCRRLPVLDASGKLLGVVTLDDMLSLLADQMTLVGELIGKQVPAALSR